MSARINDDEADYRSPETDPKELDQYAELSLADGGVVIYDRDNQNSWIQSDSAVDLESKE